MRNSCIEHHHHIRGSNQHHARDRGGVFLVPMHGGIWTMCIDLTEDEIREIGQNGLPRPATCVKYLDDADTLEPEVNDWRQIETQPMLHPQISEFFYILRVYENSKQFFFAGMQNLSISCSLVCLIILGSAALVGAFGVCQRQLSAILVTGVMYLLAGKLFF